MSIFIRILDKLCTKVVVEMDRKKSSPLKAIAMKIILSRALLRSLIVSPIFPFQSRTQESHVDTCADTILVDPLASELI